MGIYGIFLSMGSAGFISSTVGLKNNDGPVWRFPLGFPYLRDFGLFRV